VATFNPEPSRQLLQLRLSLLHYPIVLVFLILGARLWQLQIIDGAEYALRAEQNRVRTIQLVAPRGNIMDRNNTPLVENRPSYNVLLYREAIRDQAQTAAFVTDKLGIKPEDYLARLRRSRGTGLYHPIVIKEDVAIDDISVIEAHKREHPEIQLGPEPRRLYRYGKLAAHVFGYVGEISEEELLKDAFPGARVGALVGRSGIERVYNQYLIGKDGSRQVLVDSLGREVGILDEADSTIGGEVQLTLDLELQLTAENLLQDKVGAIIAMDPRNGEILAMASSPSFDPNSFSTRISEQDWNQLVTDPNHPLQNRAIQNSYPPGSVFKLIMADAALLENAVDDSTRVFCTGSAVYYNRVFHCASKTGHGTVDLETAIAKSCNIFFYELGRRMGISKIAQHALELGLGEKTGVDLPNEQGGTLPSPEWKERTFGTKWYAGETISVSIGQGPIRTTPIQILRAVSAIATDGGLTTPHVLLHTERPPNQPFEWIARKLDLGPDGSRRIRQGMWGSVNNSGTGHAAMIPGLDICGKTGTVQVMSNEKRKELSGDLSEFEDHSWFAGFASRDNPEIAVVVFIEHGGKGGIAAAPLAKEIFGLYFAKRQHRAQPETASKGAGQP
jgi:penicillin-binding protein 2